MKFGICTIMVINDGDNNGESLILLLLFEGIHTFLAFLKLCEENEMLYLSFFFSLRWVSSTPNSTDTCPFLPLVSLFLFFRGSGHLPLFISSYLFFSSSFF